ncbi:MULTISPECIES: PH domain-containing protein [unclassified Empedobacter]|uniref:PH domain-containing protein n=1 Tax=unclassified Empedobacter TaxID=2643773 RepID=UPI0025BA4479|nr:MULTISPECIES: PH domain-containing protein [unclassified Empedobacter]
MNKEFSVSMSPFFKVTTAILIVLLILIGGVLFKETEVYVAVIYAIIIYPLFAYYYLISLNKIKVDLNNIYFISKIKTNIIPINEIKIIKRKSQNNLIIVGCRGFMGLIGRSMDNYRCNIKNRTKLVAIELENVKYLVSCDQPDEFVNTINTLKNDKETP